MMDVLAAEELVEQALITMRWVPTQHQFADHPTKNMVFELNKQYYKSGSISLVQTGMDAEKEQHKSALRKVRRERRKAWMKKSTTKIATTNLVYLF